MNLGNNILKLRKDKGFSQEELAEKVKVTRQTISNWELGVTQPTPEQLKILSKIFNISIDKLLDNDVDSLLIEKVSNTEKLAGLIIKILKGLGILILIWLLICIISLVLFGAIRKETITSGITEVTINCSMDNKDYLITVGSDAYFNCSNCSKNIQSDLIELVDYSDINESIKDIGTYFSNNNGSCE